jgi:pyruvate/2-oxoglutarate dehydrogenase complex dihydrolipoamide dehydrogenase (E3) component
MDAFPKLIAHALQEEWGSSSSSRKIVSRITSANERAVKNWFEARNGPSGENLVELIRHSDAVFEAILVASGRRPYLQAIKLEAMEQPLRQLLEIIDQGRRRAEVL